MKIGLFDLDILGVRPPKKKSDVPWGGFDLSGLNITDRYDDKNKDRVPIPQGLQKDLIIRSRGKCEKCKTSLEGLKPDIHHKNSDPSNNEKRNLIVLCPNCHRRAHYKENNTETKNTTKKTSAQRFDPFGGFGSSDNRGRERKPDDILGGGFGFLGGGSKKKGRKKKEEGFGGFL